MPSTCALQTEMFTQLLESRFNVPASAVNLDDFGRLIEMWVLKRYSSRCVPSRSRTITQRFQPVLCRSTTSYGLSNALPWDFSLTTSTFMNYLKYHPSRSGTRQSSRAGAFKDFWRNPLRFCAGWSFQKWKPSRVVSDSVGFDIASQTLRT